MLLLELLKPYRILLASQSPRRHQLMKTAGFHFETVNPGHEDEDFASNLPLDEVPVFLAQKKASYVPVQSEKDLIITADTVVILNNSILNKPANKQEAISMLQRLSNSTHRVVTGVCFKTLSHQHSFSDTTEVSFRQLSDEEIQYYVTHYHPYDKAGSYGAQDWIGLVGIHSINGSYFNVMGLPVEKLYVELEKFLLGMVK
ncbi:MAG TPA: Maf family nucleotide pyrophosphatase [Bacteroidales bacterium]|nr:Maf family nucleotide pyrophosphatase [Bacteroidales bacterium]HOK97968.1 Maf family nucleotide pyrophosphatase [Bacteroidales bacterium]HPO65279.1 Maf family nucleotide pyrophosphatase [Bacteroidales bacterium]